MSLILRGEGAARRYAIVGSFQGAAVRHVALLAEERYSCGSEVRAHEMGPPMRLPGTIVADALGWIDDMNEEERTGIDDWIAEMKTLVEGGGFQSFTSYVVIPAVEKDTIAARRVYRRFSCVGFVAEAYFAGAGVTLVDETVLPEVELPLLESIWGVFPSRGRSFAGLSGDGPWRVLLPGYLLRAMALRRAELPFRPLSVSDADLVEPTTWGGAESLE